MTPALERRRSDAPSPPAGLYLHVPFCVSHCPYCDFVVVAGREARGPANRIAAFVEAVRVELELRADALDAGFGPPDVRPPLESLYLGGGTPSLLSVEDLEALIRLVRRRYGLADDAEVTLEVNPGPDERGDAALQVAAGVMRLSIGAQSFDRAELRSLGRRHEPGDVAATVGAARDAGIESVSIDLLYDLPGQTVAGWRATVEAALAQEPDHVSAYALTLDDPEAEGLTGSAGDHLPTRPGARRWRDRARAGQDEDRAAAMYELADDLLAEAGFEWYELSNWARPGHRSRHNLAYWQGGAWEAVGPGAHAFDGVSRRWNAALLDRYLAALVPRDGTPTLPPGGAVRVTDPVGDAAVLGLRTAAGLAAGTPARARAEAHLRDPLLAPLLERTPGDALRLSARGRLLADEVFAHLV